MENKKINVLIHAEIDLNLIDGSSIWITSLVNVLIQNPNVNVGILLKKPILRPILIKSLLNNNQVYFIDVWKALSTNLSKECIYNKFLYVKDAVTAINELDNTISFDIIIIRGFKLAVELSKNKELSSKTLGYFTDFPQDVTKITEESLNQLKNVINNMKYILCQTEQLIKYYKTIANPTKDNFVLLPPMIPNFPDISPTFQNTNNRLVYVGKFAASWYTLESIQAFRIIRDKYPNAEFHIAGDKFNNDPLNPNFKQEMQSSLENTYNVFWYSALSRKDALSLIANSDVGISWRDNRLNKSLEISTKLLEYGSQGKPAVINRNDINESLLGKDYPLYANTYDEFVSATETALSDSVIYKEAGIQLYEACRKFTFKEVYSSISHLPEFHNIRSVVDTK